MPKPHPARASPAPEQAPHPLANPARVTRQLVGIARPAYVAVYAEALHRLGTEHSRVISGDEGLDELSLAGGNEIAVVTDGNPGMATGGMGDVLSGILGALIAQGLSQPDAARLGAVVHACAADLAADDVGQRSLLATDLIPYLGELL